MGFKASEIYLLAYNALCCAGWAQVWVGTVNFLTHSYQMGEFKVGLEAVFLSGIADFLFISQVAALLEIFHAAIGIVRSPVMVTTMQVMSRIVVLFALTFSNDGSSK